MSAEGISRAGVGINELLVSARLEPLSPEIAAKFDGYLHLILRWNARMNLTSVRDPLDILRRHFVESIACAQSLPQGVRSLLDFGSGAGFPGVPIALCRPEVAVTLAESQNKKASFLREVVRSLSLNTDVLAQRAETAGVQFDCVTLARGRRHGSSGQIGNGVGSGIWMAGVDDNDRGRAGDATSCRV